MRIVFKIFNRTQRVVGELNSGAEDFLILLGTCPRASSSDHGEFTLAAKLAQTT